MRRWAVLGILTYRQYAPVPALRPPGLAAARYKSSLPLRPLRCTWRPPRAAFFACGVCLYSRAR